MKQLPVSGDSVTLCVPQRERMQVQVIGAGSDYLDLELPGAPRTPAEQFARASLFVEYVNDRGVCRMAGRLGPRGVLRAGAVHGDVRMRFVPTAEPALFQRREHIRAEAALRLATWAGGRQGAPEPCWTVEVSAGGMRVRGLRFPRPGDIYDFELELSQHDSAIDGKFCVVRVDESGDAGVRLSWVSDEDRARLGRFALMSMRASHRR